MRLIDADALKVNVARMSGDGDYVESVWYDIDRAQTVDVPNINIEKLTDEEQRLFLTAIGREKKLCQKIEELWDKLSLSSEDDIDLLKACEEIERKVKKVLW